MQNCATNSSLTVQLACLEQEYLLNTQPWQTTCSANQNMHSMDMLRRNKPVLFVHTASASIQYIITYGNLNKKNVYAIIESPYINKKTLFTFR